MTLIKKKLNIYSEKLLLTESMCYSSVQKDNIQIHTTTIYITISNILNTDFDKSRFQKFNEILSVSQSAKFKLIV